MVTRHQFVLADYLVFAATIVISVAIGVYYAFCAGKQRTPADYLLAGRKMKFIPVGISLFVSMESSIMMLGLPAEGYTHGVQIVVGCVPLVVVYVLVANITVPLLHPLKITSAYQYLELRFKSRAAGMLGSMLGIIYELLYMGIVLYGPAVSLQAVAGFPMWLSIPGLALMAVVYTSIGGLRAVIWTDVFQTVVMSSGLLAVLIMGTIRVGGPDAVWHVAAKDGRLTFFDFDPDPRTRHTFWNLVLSYIGHGIGIAFKQSTVQRISSTRSLNDAKRVMWIVAPAVFVISSLAVYEGIVAYAYYDVEGCDPLASGQLDSSNQITPYIVMDIFSYLPGMPGLFIASLFSASLSTLSTSLSNLSAFLLTDFVQPLVGDLAEWKATLVAKLSVVVWGCVSCLLAWLISLVGGTLSQISVTVLSSVSGPLTGLFLMGCFLPRVNAKGAMFGGVVGFILTCWVSAGMNFTPGVHKDYSLPPASTANCDDAMELISNGTDLWSTNMTLSASSYATTNQTIHFVGTESPATESSAVPASVSPEGIQHLYSISYTFISPIGLISTIMVGYIFCLITGGNKPGDVDPRYLLSWSDCLFACVPSSIRPRGKPTRGKAVYHLDNNSVKSEDIAKCPEVEVSPLF